MNTIASHLDSSSSAASDSRARARVRVRARGAAMVEYALILVAVMLGASVAIKGLGKDVSRGITESTTVVKSVGR